ncbi:MAG: ATP-binding cassette domain-containing protein [Dehalococcoidales bacterium]|nr:MAG: ATP-binding cassette domain-containing protein [Dehalococcoidales bacterium]
MENDGKKSTALISNISKTFNTNKVVDNLSFSVMPGEIFGLIGPNGAGKTTTIRMMMDIIKPDSGEISILGKNLSEDSKDKIGYLPEERGLYKKLNVLQSLSYLASLKGISPTIAREKTEHLLNRVEMLPHAKKKIEELSRGMGQIIQFLTAIIHDPSLIILDEPFANLDPVNTELLKEIVLELRNEGRAIILSTHRMNEVEELCDRILMINHGRNVLYGELSEIKSRFRNNSIFLELEGDPGELTGVTGKRDYGNYTELLLDGKTAPQQVLEQLISQGKNVNRFEVSTPSLHEIFLQVVEEGQ